MMKGHLCEQDAFKLASKYYPSKDFRSKNKKQFSNQYFTGHPDTILKTDGIVEDVKCPWTVKNFMQKKELERLHMVQIQVYMNLLGYESAKVHYCLINTPEEMILEEEKRYWFKFGCNDENKHYQEVSEMIRRNHNVDHIPEEMRIKTFAINYDQTFIDELIALVKKARIYYNTLTL